jgi:hypothetical protein
LERQILDIRPDLVMASGGLNNLWNDLFVDSRQSFEGRWPALRQALLNVKLFRLLAVATSKTKNEAETRFEPPEDGRGRWRSSDQGAVKARIGQRLWRKTSRGVSSLEIEEEQVIRGLEHDMKWMVKTAHAYDTPIIWYNYPGLTPKVKTVQGVIDRMGAELGIPVVRTEDDVARAMADGHKSGDLAVFAAGPHPTGILYGYMVESMVPHVALALREWQGIELDSTEKSAGR